MKKQQPTPIKTITYANLLPKLVPHQLDVKELESVYSVMTGLMPVLQLVRVFVVGLTDTKMVASSETMHGAPSLYYSAKQAAREKVPGADTAYTDMKKRYEKKKKEDSEEVLMVGKENSSRIS